MRNTASRWTVLSCVVALLAAAPASWAETAVTASETEPPSPALQALRRDFFDGTFNTLVFRRMDDIFDVYRVENAGTPWRIPEAPAPFDIQYTFDGKSYGLSDFLDRTYTNALLVVRDGKIVYERYRNKTHSDSHLLSMSMAKSITSMLIGAALADGYIKSVDDQIVRYVPELKQTGYDGVTVRQALLMRSGVNRQERYDYKTDKTSPSALTRELSMVQGKRRYREEALSSKRAHPPGTHFNYSTLETIVLGWVLERATGKPIQTYMSERLWKPLGAQSYGFWITDGPPGIGDAVNGMGFNATLRDYGRLGLLMLNDGMANGQRILPAAWVQESTVPAPGHEPASSSESLGYQYQWWTFHDSNAYTAIGLQGQYIYIDPDTKMVVVKLSYFPPGNDTAYEETQAFLRAVSAWAK